ncbi:MAG TPA: NADH-quinone oxidoreductase subunit N, partial [Edaphobacter sp.]
MSSLLHHIIALLPEYILTLAGILIMLAEPFFPARSSRKSLGWLAIAATVAAGLASWYQLGFGTLRAFFDTVQVDAFSVFFHLLIAAV